MKFEKTHWLDYSYDMRVERFTVGIIMFGFAWKICAYFSKTREFDDKKITPIGATDSFIFAV